MNELLNKATDICRFIIGEKTNITDDEITQAISNVTSMPIYRNIDKEKLKEELLLLYNVKVDEFQILEGRERREPWLGVFKAERASNWYFWKRYAKYLVEQKRFSPNVISNLDRLTDKILDKLFNPQRSEIVINKKGLVVGQVQSGKTANYTGLVCKAADAGFNTKPV